MKKYYIIRSKDVYITPDCQQCESPITKQLVTTDIFQDGDVVSAQDFLDWPWLIFDCDTGELYDMAPSLEIAKETIVEHFNGTYECYETELHDNYSRAMSII